MSKLLDAARVAVGQCLAVRNGEDCLVITDEPCRAVGEALFQAAKEAGAEAVLIDMHRRAAAGKEPSGIVRAAMLAADVVFAATSRSLSFTKARLEASAAGTRVASLPGVTEEMMARTLNADYERIAIISCRIAELLSEAVEAHLTTAAGTDLIFNLGGRQGYPDTGILHERGAFGNLPAGEA